MKTKLVYALGIAAILVAAAVGFRVVTGECPLNAMFCQQDVSAPTQ